MPKIKDSAESALEPNEPNEPNKPKEPYVFTGTGLLFGISTNSTAP